MVQWVRVHCIVAMTYDYRLVCSTQLVVNPWEKLIKPENQFTIETTTISFFPALWLQICSEDLYTDMDTHTL